MKKHHHFFCFIIPLLSVIQVNAQISFDFDSHWQTLFDTYDGTSCYYEYHTCYFITQKDSNSTGINYEIGASTSVTGHDFINPGWPCNNYFATYSNPNTARIQLRSDTLFFYSPPAVLKYFINLNYQVDDTLFMDLNHNPIGIYPFIVDSIDTVFLAGFPFQRALSYYPDTANNPFIDTLEQFILPYGPKFSYFQADYIFHQNGGFTEQVDFSCYGDTLIGQTCNCNETLNISQIGNSENILLYPSPASENFKIKNVLSGFIEITNIHGQQVLAQKFLENISIGVESLNQGIYFCKIMDEMGNHYEIKLLVQ